MATIIPIGDKTPQIHPTAWVAPNATLIGDVVIGEHASVFYGCVLRADINAIRVGARSNIQDNSVLHVDRDAPCTLGADVTVGHMSLVHGTTVADACLIGMHSTLLSRSSVGTGSLVAAGAVVLEGQDIPASSLVAGVPARVRRQLNDGDREHFIAHADRYVETAQLQEEPLES
ncbi:MULTISPECIES: gamma carbonic anhydrase family protein [Corynebacterium]|uniref:gamma carbonic anhydrase family protein n=1 Tax=Corynebacterium TaxID=1716 RepID=UPI00124D4DB2|nr:MULTISPECIES: gamma carbonic anhydrase family protein [Corynebacterium]